MAPMARNTLVQEKREKRKMRLIAGKRLIAGLWLTLLCAGPVWGQAVDQSQLSGRLVNPTLTGEFGQTFTPGMDGKLVAVRLFIGKESYGGSDITVRIRDMNALGGVVDTVLASATVSKEDLEDDPNWIEVALNPTNPTWEQTAGDPLALTIEQESPGGTSGQNGYGTEIGIPSPYLGGNFFESFIFGSGILPSDVDMAFQTLVVAGEYVYYFQQGVDNGQGVYFEANDVTLTRTGLNEPGDDYLRIETEYLTGRELFNSVIRFNGIETNLQDFRVVRAYITLTFYDIGSYQPWQNSIVNTYPMLKHFSDENANWTDYDTGLPWELDGAQGLTDRGDSYEVTDMGTRNATLKYHEGQKFEFELPPSLVRSWISDPASNQGVLMAMDPDYTVSVNFYSCDYAGDLSYRPLLMIIAAEGCEKIPADINDDCYVNSVDLYLMKQQWLLCDGGSADIVDGGDGCVNLLDFALLAAHWLKCSAPGDASCLWPN